MTLLSVQIKKYGGEVLAVMNAEGVEFEVYPSADTTAPNYHCEIWVAVNEKGE